VIGALNQRASIMAQTLTPDGGGGYAESWDEIAQAWISIEPVSGGDVFGPDAVESRLRHRVTLRRNASVAAGQRIVVGARTLRIHAVLDAGPQTALTTLLCEELP
jgi:SPP1 family predicted phage head-tail adaptor